MRPSNFCTLRYSFSFSVQVFFSFKQARQTRFAGKQAWLMCALQFRWITTSFLCCHSRFRFQLTTRKSAVIVKRVDQGSISRLHVCHRTQRRNQLPSQWDSKLNRERNHRTFAAAMGSSSTHKETVFHLVQSAATPLPAATTWNKLSQLRWLRRVSHTNLFNDILAY